MRLVRVAMLFACFGAACTQGAGAQSGPGTSGGGPVGTGGPGGRTGTRAALPVRTASVTPREITYSIKSLGSLEAEELIQITAEVDGAVGEVFFHEGDRVGPERVLLTIDPDRYRLELDRAEANYRKALADSARAEADLKRREELARQQLISVEELNRLRQDFEGFAATAASTKAARDLAAQNAARASVRARRPGTVDSRAADPGQFVRAGAVLATLLDTSRLRLRFKISEAESLRVRVGDRLRFTVSAVGPEQFEGRIYHVGQVADPATRQVEVLAWVANRGRLKPGFFAETSIPAGSKNAALVVPETSIQATERGFVAYVVENGTARARDVQLGLRTDDGGVEILGGLSAGETVITEGSDRLSEGMPVASAGETDGGGAANRRASPAPPQTQPQGRR